MRHKNKPFARIFIMVLVLLLNLGAFGIASYRFIWASSDDGEAYPPQIALPRHEVSASAVGVTPTQTTPELDEVRQTPYDEIILGEITPNEIRRSFIFRPSFQITHMQGGILRLTSGSHVRYYRLGVLVIPNEPPIRLDLRPGVQPLYIGNASEPNYNGYRYAYYGQPQHGDNSQSHTNPTYQGPNSSFNDTIPSYDQQISQNTLAMDYMDNDAEGQPYENEAATLQNDEGEIDDNQDIEGEEEEEDEDTGYQLSAVGHQLPNNPVTGDTIPLLALAFSALGVVVSSLILVIVVINRKSEKTDEE